MRTFSRLRVGSRHTKTTPTTGRKRSSVPRGCRHPARKSENQPKGRDMNGLSNRACNVYAAKLGTFARVAGIAVLLAACVGIMEPAQGQTLTFTVETSTADGRTVTPR